MLSGRALTFSLLVLVTSVVGCKRDLGECNLDGQTPEGRPIDGPAAFDIAYRFFDGQPMYEGQALVQSSCAGGDDGYCHSPEAVGADRIGVPAQLDFDVRLACTDAACASPSSCEGGQADTEYCQGLRSLHGNQSKIRDWAEGIIQEIRAGAMPPGEAGRRYGASAPWIRGPRADPDAPWPRTTELPRIGSKEAEEIIRNWLACQAPVIARTEIPPDPAQQLQRCSDDDEPTCIYTGPPCDDPSWSAIYACLIFTECVSCHGPPNNNLDQNPNNLGRPIPGGTSPTALEVLDLSGLDKTDTSGWAADSYLAVVGPSADTGGVCAGFGTLVVPFDPATDSSLMIDKMRNNPPACGTVMPQSGSVAEPLIQVVEEWINLGALND